jgi:hypothetical protein
VQANAHRWGRARHVLERGLVMKALLCNHGFAVSIPVAVVIVTVFAFVFRAPSSLVAALLVLGLFTALTEYNLHSRGGSQ